MEGGEGSAWTFVMHILSSMDALTTIEAPRRRRYPVVQLDDAVVEALDGAQVEGHVALTPRDERDAVADEHGDYVDDELVDRARIQKGGDDVATAHQPDVLAKLRSKTVDERADRLAHELHAWRHGGWRRVTGEDDITLVRAELRPQLEAPIIRPSAKHVRVDRFHEGLDAVETLGLRAGRQPLEIAVGARDESVGAGCDVNDDFSRLRHGSSPIFVRIRRGNDSAKVSAAVDVERRTIDEARRGTRQKYDDSRDLLRLGHSAREQLRDGVAGGAGDGLLAHHRAREPGRDAVHADGWRELAGRALGQVDDPGLGCRVVRMMRSTGVRGDARHGHDRRAVRQQRAYGAQQVERPVEVRADDGIPFVGLEGLQRREDVVPRVEHGDVEDAAGERRYLFHGAFDVGRVAHVERYAPRTAAGGADVGRDP